VDTNKVNIHDLTQLLEPTPEETVAPLLKAEVAPELFDQTPNQPKTIITKTFEVEKRNSKTTKRHR
jgi:hypothetical protein